MAPPPSTASAAVKTAKKAAAKPSTAKSAAVAKSRSHPTYYEMIKEAVVALKERTGSSQPAIAKFIEEKQKDLPANYKKLLSVQLKRLVASGKLTKVKNSYKLGAVEKTVSDKPKKSPAAEKKSTAAAKEKTVKKVTAKATPAAEKKKVKAKSEKAVKAKKVVKKAVASLKSPAKKATPVKKVKTPVKKPKSIKATPAAKKAKK